MIESRGTPARVAAFHAQCDSRTNGIRASDENASAIRPLYFARLALRLPRGGSQTGLIRIRALATGAAPIRRMEGPARATES